MAIALAGAGEFGGADVGQRELVCCMYGPDAERLIAVVGTGIAESPFDGNSHHHRKGRTTGLRIEGCSPQG
jgi:hypothetical protein